MCAEAAGGNFRAEGVKFCDNRFDERFGDLSGCGLIPRRTSSLAGVGVQRELADHEKWRGDVGARLFVVENSQRVKLSGKAAGLLEGVGVSDANEDDDAGPADFADAFTADDDPRFGDALDDGTHAIIVARDQRPNSPRFFFGVDALTGRGALGAGRIGGGFDGSSSKPRLDNSRRSDAVSVRSR